MRFGAALVCVFWVFTAGCGSTRQSPDPYAHRSSTPEERGDSRVTMPVSWPGISGLVGGCCDPSVYPTLGCSWENALFATALRSPLKILFLRDCPVTAHDVSPCSGAADAPCSV